LDEYAFAKAGAKALLVEGDPALPPPRDDSDDKNTQLQNEGTFLRFIVSRAVMDGLAEAADHGARLRAAWDMRFQWAYPKTVIGCIPGSETEADNELIIATALDTPAAKPGARPGRALPFFMALAEAMARQHLKPRHPIVFMASNGAWAGQLGTRAYLDSPMTFKPSRKGSWMGDEEDTHGLVGDYLLARNKAAGHFATGRHVLFLADGDDPIPTLCTGAGTPFFVLPGERMGRDLTRSAGELGLPWRTSTASTGFEHERFSERWNPAATLMLPAMDRDGFSDVARVLATFIRHDAVSLAPTPLEWVRHTAAALLVAAGAALVASRLSRTAKARQPRTPDPYDAFLKRHEEDGEAP
ncbi:MAG TPA: hypothetical protein VN436_03805, partial [Holophaga sp.]|nr:hypothetical protein [Holophaga sp.]